MARDIAYTVDGGTTYSDRGDITNSTNLSFVRDRMIIGIEETVDLSPPLLSDTEIEEQRGDIEAAIRRNQFTEEPIRVTVESVDYDESQIQYSIETSRLSDTISTTS